MSRTVRDVHNGQSKLARYRAERLLRSGYGQLRSKVLAIVRSKLRAAGASLDQADLEGCYSQAWHGLYAEVLAGETIENPQAWLVLVTFRRAIDEARSASRARPAAGEDVASDEGRAGRSELDLAGALDDRARLRSLFEGLRATLSTRECEAASLCYLQGLSRAEAAARMGISERRMEKLMEGRTGVAGRVGELLVTIAAGGWCERQSSLMRAYALGILDPAGQRHVLAVAHTRQCPACRAHVAALRGLASVLPPLPLLLGTKGGAGTRYPAKTLVTGARRFAGRALRQVVAGRGLSLPAKLAVTGATLLGTGSAYLLTRPSLSPARTGAALLTPASSRGRTGTTVAGAHGDGGRRARPHRQVHSSRRRRVQSSPIKPRATLRAPVSAREFSPERIPREASASQAASGHEGEFGIEGG